MVDRRHSQAVMKKGQTKGRAVHDKKMLEARRKRAHAAAESTGRAKASRQRQQFLRRRKLMKYQQAKLKRRRGQLITPAEMSTGLHALIWRGVTKASSSGIPGSSLSHEAGSCHALKTLSTCLSKSISASHGTAIDRQEIHLSIYTRHLHT